MSSDSNKKTGPRRRDFLAGLSSGLILGTFGLPRPSRAIAGGLERAPAGAKIVSVGIFPPIGISRVGSGPVGEHFLAPEVPGVAPHPAGGTFKDAKGRIKKQVQRFFLYGFDKDGKVVGEITGKTAAIKWTVHVANTKAAWYGFNNPLDLGPKAPGIPAQLRNAGITGKAERAKRLVIDPGPVSIAHTDKGRRLMAGHFWDDQTRVKLGELAVDADGRLLVIPGDGISASVLPNNPIKDFTKNDGWYDDWCDGWVKASVTLNNTTTSIEALPAWIACCGPDFAPEIPAFTTLYDTIADAMVKRHESLPAKRFTRPAKLAFSTDIYPIFYRLGLMKWISGEAAVQGAWLRIGDFEDINYVKRLADLRENELRAQVFAAMRDPTSSTEQRYRLPYMLGSGVDYSGPLNWLMMPELQYWVLQQWKAGHYDNDFQQFLETRHNQVNEIGKLPPEKQPAALTQAALEACSGGNFHPGVELTWVLGHPELFDDNHPFRIQLGNRSSLIQDLGFLITTENAIPPSGTSGSDAGANGKRPSPPDGYPIGPQMPGDLTRWMGLPWQPDAFSCQAVNYANDFPTVVWWPALLPVDVLPEVSYKQILRTDLSREQRIKFASHRVPWARGAAGIGYHANASYFDGLNRMVDLWERMGFVVKRATPPDLRQGPNGLPDVVYVEMERGSMDLVHNEPPLRNLPIDPTKGSATSR